MILAVALIELITVHMIDGRVIQLNPREITQVIHNRETGNDLVVDKVKCIIRLTDGSFVSVAETCEQVQAKLAGP